MPRTPTAGLTSLIRHEIGALHTERPRVTARRIEPGDARTIADAVRRAIRAAAPTDYLITVNVRGGDVAPSALRQGRPEADHLEIKVFVHGGSVSVDRWRGRARRGPRRGLITVARAARRGQSAGRVLFTD